MLCPMLCPMLRPMLLAGLGLAAAFAAQADTPPWGGVWAGGPHPVDETMPRLVYAREAGTSVPVAHGLPYGLNRGTCDRSQVAGAAIVDGGALAEGMDEIDEECVAAALAYLPDEHLIVWAGTDGATHRVMPLRSWLSGDRPCRELEATSLAGGHFRRIRGVVCRREDGRWAQSG